MDDDPLVVPADDALGGLECRLAALDQSRVGHHVVEDLVVELQHRQLELADEDVLVVPRVPDQSGLLDVARQVVVLVLRVASDEELVTPGGRVVQERVVSRPATVERVQVVPWAAEVRQRVGIVLLGQARLRIERDVVVDELPEVGVAGRDVGVVELGRWPLPVLGHQPGNLGNARVVRDERQQPEHPAEPTLVETGQRDVAKAPELVRMTAGGTLSVAHVVP